MGALSEAVAGVLVAKFILSEIVDPVFFVGLIALYIYIRRLQTENAAFKDKFYAFLYLVAGQLLALNIPMLIGLIANLISFPIPQSLINVIGIFPLVIGLAKLYDLIKDLNCFSKSKSTILKSNMYQSIGGAGSDENIITKKSKDALAYTSKFIKNPFVLEVFCFYIVCFSNSISAYKSLFSWLDIATSIGVMVTFNIFIFIKSLVVVMLIQWSKMYTDACCPTECWDFFFPGDCFADAPKYLDSSLLIALGVSLLGQSLLPVPTSA